MKLIALALIVLINCRQQCAQDPDNDDYDYDYDETEGPGPQCLAIEQCEHLMWLMQNKFQLKQHQPTDIVKIIRNMECDTAEVHCLEAEAEYFMEEEPDQESENEIMDTKENCGYLSFLFVTSDLAPLVTFRGHNASRNVIEVLDIQDPNEVELVRVKSHGSCCWKLFKDAEFQGDLMKLLDKPDQHLMLNDQNMTVNSFQRTKC